MCARIYIYIDILFVFKKNQLSERGKDQTESFFLAADPRGLGLLSV